MLQARKSSVLCACLALLCAALGNIHAAKAQGVLSTTGQVGSILPQSRLAEPAAAMPLTCSSISSLSRRCFFTFAKECKKRGESRDHCARMDGFCHACTDIYATCRGDANRLQATTKSAVVDCQSCNVAYGRCIERMVQQYGGKLIKVD